MNERLSLGTNGAWILDKEIGRGAYGKVYLAVGPSGERAAVKVCRRGFARRHAWIRSAGEVRRRRKRHLQPRAYAQGRKLRQATRRPRQGPGVGGRCRRGSLSRVVAHSQQGDGSNAVPPPSVGEGARQRPQVAAQENDGCGDCRISRRKICNRTARACRRRGHDVRSCHQQTFAEGAVSAVSGSTAFPATTSTRYASASPRSCARRWRWFSPRWTPPFDSRLLPPCLMGL